MRKKIFLSILGLLSVYIYGQKDTISITVKPTNDPRIIDIKEKIKYTNHLKKDVSQIKLLNWVTAYQKKTNLYKRKLEDRDTDLHFAPSQDLGKLIDLTLIGPNTTKYSDLNEENIFIDLSQPLKQGESQTLEINYKLQLPWSKFTKYGYEPTKLILKYFFLVPDGFETEKQENRYYFDLEENQNTDTYWKINFDYPDAKIVSNLKGKNNQTFEGKLNVDPVFLISKTPLSTLFCDVNGQKVQIDFGYFLDENESSIIQQNLQRQLGFIKEKFGFLPDKIFITEKDLNKYEFFANDDIKILKKKVKMFPDTERLDMDYFSVISQSIINQSLNAEKYQNHWIYNGLKTYLEYNYLQKYYADRKIFGDLSEKIKLWKLKPLNWFYGTTLKLTDRYYLGYEYMTSQNLDQKINQNLSKLSNFNEIVISHFETGMLFNYIAEEMGEDKFEEFIQNYISQHKDNIIDSKDFIDQLKLSSDHSSDFLEELIEHKNRINFSLKSFKKEGDQINLHIKKNSNLQVPFQITTYSENNIAENTWKVPTKNLNQYENVKDSATSKIVINDHFIFPEYNLRDNYLYTKGFFSNMKKIQLKLFKDIPNPEYNQIFILPKLGFNAYDKVLLGLRINNSSFFEQKFNYSLTPYYSTGTGSLTGSAGVSYNIQPSECFFKNLIFGVSGSYFHYDYDLSYRKFDTSASLIFNKNPRTQIARAITFGYSHFERELSELLQQENAYGKYNLWNINYIYSDNRAIHEKYLTTGFQWMEDFQKLTLEGYYRWEYAQGRKISFRLFSGYFINNNTRNNFFDFGVSRVSNYAFSYGLLGQSASQGLFAQQYVMAEGAFKSNFKTYVNNWITSVNIDSHLWKMFNLYADAGIYKNKNQNAQFIWDSGIKVKVIPDFLEVYFPIQSSIGFEPAFKDYGYRIRYTLNLNLGSVISHLRRGWY